MLILDREEHTPFVRRDLPETYTPGVALTVVLEAAPLDVVTVYAVEDRLPRGWLVAEISHEGTYDSATGKVKFGPFFDHRVRTLTYQATPPGDATGPREFSGLASANGNDSRIGGDHIITNGRVHHPADRSPEDFAIRVGELTAYATAWKIGEEWPGGPNPIPQSYVTRAGEIWRKGESYRFDVAAGPAPLWWVPGTGDGTLVPLAQVTLEGRIAAPEALIGFAPVLRALEVGHPPGRSRVVKIAIQPADGVSAYSVEERVPRDWPVSNVSHDGHYDSQTGTIRWGLFLDDEARVLTYEITLPVGQLRGGSLQGAVSFDGIEVPIRGGGETEALSVHDFAPGRVRNLIHRGESDVEISFAGDIGRRYTVQVSSDLVRWTDLDTVLNESGDILVIDRDASSPVRYYRTKPSE